MSLVGKRIVNTRAEHQAAEFDALLRAQGAVPLDYPCITIAAPENTDALDDVLRAPGDLLVLTSANTVMILRQRLQALGLSLKGARAAAVGTATAQAAREQLGVEVALIPDQYTAAALVEALPITHGMRIVLPQSASAGPALADSLRARGADVMAIIAYQTLRGTGGIELAPGTRSWRVDGLTFTSSSTVRYFVERLHVEGGAIAALNGVCIACIGPRTAQIARDTGLGVTIEPEIHTLKGLVDSLASYFQNQQMEATDADALR